MQSLVFGAVAQSQLAGVDMSDPRRAQPPVSLKQIRSMAQGPGAAHVQGMDPARRANLPAENRQQDERRLNQLKGIKKEMSSMFRPTDYARRITDFEDGLIAMELQPQPNDPEHELRDMNGEETDGPVQEPATGAGPWGGGGGGGGPWGFGGASAPGFFGGMGADTAAGGSALPQQMPQAPPAWGAAPGMWGQPAAPQAFGATSQPQAGGMPSFAPFAPSALPPMQPAQQPAPQRQQLQAPAPPRAAQQTAQPLPQPAQALQPQQPPPQQPRAAGMVRVNGQATPQVEGQPK